MSQICITLNETLASKQNILNIKLVTQIRVTKLTLMVWEIVWDINDVTSNPSTLLSGRSSVGVLPKVKTKLIYGYHIIQCANNRSRGYKDDLIKKDLMYLKSYKKQK